MNLINKKLLQQKINSFEFPNEEALANAKKLLENWQKALKDSDLEKTKEKSVQGKFLSTFFETILGYSDVTTGQEEWTLIQHPRIENDSKEPDGSLGWFSKDKKTTRAVIELKDAKTQLDKKQNRGSEKLTPIEQAYLYATKYDGCNWIIVSNFKEIRLYNKHKTQEYYEKFDVVDLIEETELKRFYFLLSKETLISKDKESVIDVLAKDTLEVEQDVTKQFYAEYRQVRLNLLGHLSENNTGIDKVVLLEKAQKLLDRFIFTLFCEDTSTLLPLNIVKNTYERAVNSLSPSDERVWAEFKGLFFAIDKGNDRVKPPINAYNGGLFAFDEVLDNLSIKDEFWNQLMSLTSYDFETDLNVNILGHIFEQSISDLESLKSELRGEEQDPKKSKRKKDGIFYTPEYITRYIVESTIGKYLEDNPDKIRDIKILDPACGSGAFLNQAHSYLQNEYKMRHEAKLEELAQKGEHQSLFDYNPAENNKSILLENLYGVDLNQESVEITKLALWLKTARSTEPLQNLDKNIKCGNSLIDDHQIAGDKAFNWNTQFKDIMDDGGFDVIIGNPPYVGTKQIGKNDRQYYWTKYADFLEYEMDLYQLFLINNSKELLKNGGYLGFITPDSFFTAESFSKLRNHLLNNFHLLQVIDFPYRFFPFEDVNTETCICIYQKLPNNPQNISRIAIAKREPTIDGIVIKNEVQINQSDFTNIYRGKIITQTSSALSKILSKEHTLDEIISLHKGWMSIPKQVVVNGEKIETGVFDAKDVQRLNIWSRVIPYLEGKDIHRYFVDTVDKYVVVDDIDKKTKQWHMSKKIILQRIVGQNKRKIFATIDENSRIIFPSANIINLDENLILTVLGILNSSTVNYYYNTFYGESNTNVTKTAIDTIPTPEIKTNNPLIDSNVIDILKYTNLLHNAINDTLALLESSYKLVRNTKLSNFYQLGWNEFIEEFEKQDVKPSLSRLEELQGWFREKQKELSEYKKKIDEANRNIDNEVYRLYELTQDEIKIIESSM